MNFNFSIFIYQYGTPKGVKGKALSIALRLWWRHQQISIQTYS
ncbi:hypothetical protein WAF17_13690 [Bernardetia sp. ABR2-2B]